MKNLVFKIFFILIVCIGIEGGYAMSGGGLVMSKSKLNKPWLKDAPMSVELYQYIAKDEKQRPDITREQMWKELTKIIEKHIPIGTNPDEAVSIALRNHFDCGKILPIKNKRYFFDTSDDEEYVCVISDFYIKKGGLISDTLRFEIAVRENKATIYNVKYTLMGP